MTTGTRQREATAAKVATYAGSAVRRIGLGIPGTVGPLAVCVGFWMLAPWLGVIVLGLILWALDRRVP